MAYPGARTYPGPSTFPGIASDPLIVDAAPPAPSVGDLLATGAPLRWRVTVLSGGRPVIRDGGPLLLPISGGQIQARDGLPSREASGMSLHGRVWVPEGAGHVLDPDAGHEFLIEVGLIHPAVDPVWWPVMVADLAEGDVSLSDGPAVGVDVAAPDRSRRVSTALMLAGQRVTTGTPTEVALRDLVASTGTGVPTAIRFVGSTVATGLIVGEPGKDPLAAATEQLAKPRGVDVRCSPAGEIGLVPVLDPSVDVPRWVWRTGDHPVFKAARSLHRSVGAVLVPWTGQAPEEDQDAPTGVVAVPDERALPREWWDGDASTVRSPDQAREAGQAWLTRRRTQADAPTLTTLFDPRVDVGDIVRVEHERLALAATCRITGLSFDIGGALMDVTLGYRRLEVTL